MCEDVAVGMPREASRVVELDPAEYERHALCKRVRIDADPDPVLSHAGRLRQPRRNPLQIGCGRHLQQTLVSGNDLDAPSRSLDERGTVGALAGSRRP